MNHIKIKITLFYLEVEVFATHSKVLILFANLTAELFCFYFLDGFNNFEIGNCVRQVASYNQIKYRHGRALFNFFNSRIKGVEAVVVM